MHQDDDENYLSLAEINESSIISDMADLHFSKIDQIPIVSTFKVKTANSAINDLVQTGVHDVCNDTSAFTEDVFDDGIHLISSTSSTGTNRVIDDSVATIVENNVFHETDNTERANNSNRIKLPVIIEAMNSATRSYNPYQKLGTSDNSKFSGKSIQDSCTPRTVRFQEVPCLPTVSVIHDAPPIKPIRITNVPLIHSVIFCHTSSSFNINSVNHSTKLMDAEDWRRAYPEPDLSSFDNSIYVSVAIQAMSIDDVDKAFPSMSNTTYGSLQSTFQIDGGASLTAISEEKANQLHCKFIEREKL